MTDADEFALALDGKAPSISFLSVSRYNLTG
jgi:hypothetical protein